MSLSKFCRKSGRKSWQSPPNTGRIMSASSAPWRGARRMRKVMWIFWWMPVLRISSWFPAGLMMDLEELLDCEVDVVTERGLRPRIKDRVLKEARPL